MAFFTAGDPIKITEKILTEKLRIPNQVKVRLLQRDRDRTHYAVVDDSADFSLSGLIEYTQRQLLAYLTMDFWGNIIMQRGIKVGDQLQFYRMTNQTLKNGEIRMRVTRKGITFPKRREVEVKISLLNQQGEKEYFPCRESLYLSPLRVADPPPEEGGLRVAPPPEEVSLQVACEGPPEEGGFAG